MTWIFWLIFGLYVAGLVSWGTLTLVYTVRSPWRDSGIGRALVASWTALAAVLALAALYRIVTLPLPVVVALAVAVLVAVDVTPVMLLVVVLRLQRQDDETPHRRATDHR